MSNSENKSTWAQALVILAIIAGLYLYNKDFRDSVKSSLSGDSETKDHSTGNLEGQVFIATEGGQSVKLALTDINIYSHSEIEIAYTNFRKEAEERSATYKQNMRLLENELSNLRRAYLGRENSTEFASQVQSIQFKTDILRKGGTTEASHFFQHLRSPFTSVTTDADGKFSISIPVKGRFGLAATNSRKVGLKKEEYLWLIWVSLDGHPSKTIVLSNRNLVSESDPDNIIR